MNEYFKFQLGYRKTHKSLKQQKINWVVKKREVRKRKTLNRMKHIYVNSSIAYHISLYEYRVEIIITQSILCISCRKNNFLRLEHFFACTLKISGTPKSHYK